MFGNSSSKEDKSCYAGNPVKHALRVCEKTFVVIHESLVKELDIDENTWFEQIPDENGIFLRIRRRSY